MTETFKYVKRQHKKTNNVDKNQTCLHCWFSHDTPSILYGLSGVLGMRRSIKPLPVKAQV